MKRTLEAVVVFAALALGAFVAVQWKSRRDLSRPAAVNPASRPGTDVESPETAAPAPGNPKSGRAAAHAGSVSVLPMVKMSRPPRSPKRGPAVPPPAVSTP